MKQIQLVLAFVVVAAATLGVAGGSQNRQPAPDSAKEARLNWFRDAKYGLFIHWGLYAIPAGEWKGRRSLGLGEWIMNRSQIPVREY
ncbi:MAG TPA: alpha-L-fucosidase, partial [Terriglobia bacterium]|nr:alpha-L-fucosidase [Terriglobia bacterium]